MMLELTHPFPVKTPLGYGWAIICSRESNLANDIWTVAMEKGGAIVHFRSEQIRALPNGTLDIEDDEPKPRRKKKRKKPAPLD